MRLKLGPAEGPSLHVSDQQRPGHVSVFESYEHGDDLVGAPWVHLTDEEARAFARAVLDTVGDR